MLTSTVVGSYPKISSRDFGPNLRQAFHRYDRGEIGAVELTEIQRATIARVVREQEEAGIDVVTDGQIRWDDAQTYFARQLTGFAINGLQRYFDTNIYYREPVAEREVAWTAPMAVRDYEFAHAHSARPVKAVITGPFTLAALSRNQHYANRRTYMQALADALNHELRALQHAGAQVLQIDEPAICRHAQEYDLFADAIQRLLSGISAKTILCMYFGDIGGIYPRVLDLPCDVLGLDFVAGYRNWEILGRAPFSKDLMFGILDARNTRVESVDEVVAAIGKVTAMVPAERLMVSPSAGLEFLPRSVAKRKLQRLVEATRTADGTLQEVRV